MKKFLAVTLSVLCVFFAFGYLGKSVEDSRRRPKSTQTEQAQEQEDPTETNKYHAGAVLTFGETVSLPSEPIEQNSAIKFTSVNFLSAGELSKLNVRYTAAPPPGGMFIHAYDENMYDKEIMIADVWQGGGLCMPDVWTLTADIPETETVLRAWLDENVTVS